jgi:hypothetical protein
MNSLNKKLYFLIFMLFSGLCINAQVDHTGNFYATGSLQSQYGKLILGNSTTNDHTLERTNNITTTLISGHSNQVQLAIETNQDERLGSIMGHNAAFGLRDSDGDWFINTYANQYATLRVDNTIAMQWYADGKVSIGDVNIAPAGYKLFVEGGILSESLRVAVNGEDDWADFVFSDEYQLMPLTDVKSFIDKNNHLPDVPSAEDMVKKGLDVLQSDAILLQKIEEAYLYIIDQQEQIVQQNKQIVEQQVQIDQILKELENHKIKTDEK